MEGIPFIRQSDLFGKTKEDASRSLAQIQLGVPSRSQWLDYCAARRSRTARLCPTIANQAYRYRSP